MLGRLTDYLYLHARSSAGSVAAREAGTTLTYVELVARVEQLQRRLVAAGVGAGDRVAVLAVPSIDYYVSLLATIGIGAMWVGLNPRYRYEEISFILQDAAPKLVMYHGDFEGRDYENDFARVGTGEDLSPAIHRIPPGGVHELAIDECPDELCAGLRAASSRREAAVIVYTSGSSGRPKGALLSHFALIYGAEAQLQRWNVAPVRELCFWPINHVGCIGDVTATALVSGGQLTFQARFEVPLVLEALRTGDATVFLAVPTMLQLMIADPNFRPDVFRDVQLIVWGGAALPRPIVEQLAGCGPRLATIYGMTEAAANTCYTDEAAPVGVLAETAGKPLPQFPCRIVDGDRICGVGEPGEIQHRGPYLFLGYHNQPEATEAAFTADGWYHTRDIGMWRKDGNLQLVGRLTDMFKSGGYNVYPREIELCIESCPGVALAAVVSAPDPLYQEVGVAFVVSEPKRTLRPETVREFCREHLANYKVPKRVVIKDALPLLPIGKVDRNELQRLARDVCGI